MLATELLLTRTRQLTKVLQSQAQGEDRIADLVDTLANIVGGDVLVVSRKGVVLNASGQTGIQVPTNLDDELTTYLAKLDEATALSTFPLAGSAAGQRFNVTFDNLHAFPTFGGGDRLGTLLVNKALDDAGLVLAEYANVVVGAELLRSYKNEDAHASRKLAAAKVAISTLSYSETQAVQQLFKEFTGSEGLVVASKIADGIGVTRSVLVNALRKLESAGIVTSRSLGMKGTYVKVLNDAFVKELGKLQ